MTKYKLIIFYQKKMNDLSKFSIIKQYVREQNKNLKKINNNVENNIL